MDLKIRGFHHFSENFQIFSKKKENGKSIFQNRLKRPKMRFGFGRKKSNHIWKSKKITLVMSGHDPLSSEAVLGVHGSNG